MARATKLSFHFGVQLCLICLLFLPVFVLQESHEFRMNRFILTTSFLLTVCGFVWGFKMHKYSNKLQPHPDSLMADTSASGANEI